MPPPSEFPLQREGGVFVATVLVAGPRGERVLRLAVDTGASITMIPPKAAISVGIHPGRAKHFREVITANGKVLIPLIIISRLTLFGKTIRSLSLTCHDLPAESPLDGLLGLDALDHIGAVIDVRRSTLTC